MSRRKRNPLRRWLWIGSILIVIAFFTLTNPGRWLVSLVFSGSQHSPSSKITRIGIPLPDGYSVFGIDVSRYQSRIDWKRVKAFRSGSFSTSFVFIKATEGTSYVDPLFFGNWKGAREQGIPRGAYHYFKPGRNAEAQANHFCRNVSMKKGDLPPVLDIEEMPVGYSKAKLTNDVLVWLRIVKRHFGIKPIVYTGAVFYEKYIAGTAVANYPLWVAHYYEERPATFARWTFWQFSDKAQIDGIEGPVDANVFNGSLGGLNQLTLQ